MRTPSGRTATVGELRPDGKRDLTYIDLEGGAVALSCSMLTMVRSAPIVPWREHKL